MAHSITVHDREIKIVDSCALRRPKRELFGTSGRPSANLRALAE